MELEKRIYQDYVTALKNKEKAKTDFLSFIRAELKNTAIGLKKDSLDDNEALGCLRKQKKRLQDSQEAFKNSGRPEAIAQVEIEIALLEEYLPKAIPQEQLTQIIETVIVDTQAIGVKDMGKVIKETLTRTSGQADPKLVSEIVKVKLSGK